MLTAYEAIYHQGQLHWLDKTPPTDKKIRVMVVADLPEEKEVSPSFQKDDDIEDDSTLNAFLSFLDKEIATHLELTRPVDEEQLKRIAKLIEGVEVN